MGGVGSPLLTCRPAGGGGYVPVQVVVPITDAIALNADGPEIPIVAAIASITTVYIRSKTNATLTATLYCYNQAGTEQWTETIALSAAKYNTKAITRATAANDYLHAKITAYTSGGEDISVVAAGKRTVTAT